MICRMGFLIEKKKKKKWRYGETAQTEEGEEQKRGRMERERERERDEWSVSEKTEFLNKERSEGMRCQVWSWHMTRQNQVFIDSLHISHVRLRHTYTQTEVCQAKASLAKASLEFSRTLALLCSAQFLLPVPPTNAVQCVSTRVWTWVRGFGVYRVPVLGRMRVSSTPTQSRREVCEFIHPVVMCVREGECKFKHLMQMCPSACAQLGASVQWWCMWITASSSTHDPMWHGACAQLVESRGGVCESLRVQTPDAMRHGACARRV